MGELIPHLTILPAAQQRLWPELASTPKGFVLYGGTALALRLGHRTSVDFDFFSTAQFDPDQLMREVPYLRGAERVQIDPNTLTCRVDRSGPVLISYFGNLHLGQVSPPELAQGNALPVASLLDIAGTKLAVIQKRAEVKDYVDLDALLVHGTNLAAALAAGKVVYGRDFNPLIALKALCYFGDVPKLSEPIRERLRSAVAAVDVTQLPNINAHRLRDERSAT